MPFVVGAVAVAAGIGVLATDHRMLTGADADLVPAVIGPWADDVAGEVADEFGGTPGAIDDELQLEVPARS